MKQAFGILTILTTVLVLDPTAWAWSSQGTCKRTLKCTSGGSLKNSGSLHWCEVKSSGGTVVPTYWKANLVNDWKFDSSNGYCYRYKGKSKVTLASQITCKSGDPYKSSCKRCEKAPGTNYFRPYLLPGAPSSADLSPSTSRTARDISLTCPSGFVRKGYAQTSGTWCEKSVSAGTSTATPKCGSANGHSDWWFDAGEDTCCRHRKTGKQAKVCRARPT